MARIQNPSVGIKTKEDRWPRHKIKVRILVLKVKTRAFQDNPLENDRVWENCAGNFRISSKSFAIRNKKEIVKWNIFSDFLNIARQKQYFSDLKNCVFLFTVIWIYIIYGYPTVYDAFNTLVSI